MAGDESTFDDLGGRRDYSRVALVVVAMIAVLLATMAVPALSPAGTDSPASSLVPIPEQLRQGGGGSSASGAGGSGLGALSPGSSTDVGGSLGGESALRSQSDEVHFRVRSTEPTYMRTGAYGEYTGEGWEQRGETTPIDGDIPVSGQRGTEVTYEVTLERGASSLPTVWQPARISREDTVLSANGAVQSDRTVPAGTSYTGVSYQPPDDPALLAQAGRGYPDEIEQRYTQLPDDQSDRLGTFTDDLTADADNPYEQARTIEQWLETNKEYSLNASHDQDSDTDVATQFVFDMDTGYCEYFATAMVTMLRTQDIPARYVVGYSTGEEVSENTYSVTGMNAHAWVEVYFPEVGWVRFDPTPGNERRQQEAESLGQETPTPTPTDTPDETPTPDATATSEGTATPDEPATETETTTDAKPTTPTETPTETETGDDLQFTLNRTAVPGSMVTVTVTDDGVPVADAEVLFNGDPVGVTTTDGNVTARVPYEETLNITVAGNANERVVSYGAPSRENGRLFRPADPSTNDVETYDLNTTARLVLTGSIHTGSEVALTALVSGEPVREATVSVDGTRVAITDESGQATITLPADPGETTIAVERGAVSGNRTLSLGALSVSVDPTAPLALPWTGARVNATIGGEPAAGAAVTLDGQQVGTTGAAGTATVTLPLNASATAGAQRYGQSGTTAITGLYLNLGIVVGSGILGLVVVGVIASRAAITPRRVGHWFVVLGRGIVATVVRLGGLFDRLLTRCYRRFVLTVAHLRALLGRRLSPAALLAAFRAWFETRSTAVRTSLSERVEAVTSFTGNGERGPADAHTTVREGWSTFLGHVTLARPGRRTPEAIAAHAIEVDDLPAEAVWTLVEAFRAVEYGQRDPSDQVLAVDEAVEAIERAIERADDADGTDAAGGEPGVAD